MADSDLPIALRRTRRSNVGTASCSEGPDTHRKNLKTPRRKVRFSDPGPSACSGLTPMVRRISVGTPKRRQSSTPTSASRPRFTSAASRALPESGDVTFLPLRQVLDGRVQRRIRRNGLSEEMNTIQQERRRRAQQTKEEVERLREELKARDREIYELQNATIIMDTGRLWDLERQVEELKSELQRRSSGEVGRSRSYNWTMASPEHFPDDFMDMKVDEEEEFGETTIGQLITSTPSRARSSFPTPPATSPTVPGSPFQREVTPAPQTHVSVQAALPDPENQRLEDEIASLHLEMCKLTTTLDSYKALTNRLTERLPRVSQTLVDVDSNVKPVEEVLETQVEELLRSMSDRTAALTHLTSCISDLGFPGNDASEMITSLASGFRAARLELEYLTPGEIVLPLTSHGAEVLDLLLTRLRNMAKKIKEDEDAIDEYHEIEQSLRKQLDARVSVMDGLKAEMAKAETLMGNKNARIRELEVGNERLKGAVDGYIRDIAELEKLVQQMEQDNRDAKATHHAHLESNRRVLTSKENHIAELEHKLTDALQRSSDLQKEIIEMQALKTQEISALNQQHGAALAMRDSRVAELRGEVDRLNGSLRVAYETIRSLRVENGGLLTQMEEESDKAKTVIDSMKEELQRVLTMSQEFLDSGSMTSRTGSDTGSKRKSAEGDASEVVRPGGFFGGDLAKRGSKRLRRKHDSGLGFLNEEQVDV